MSVLPVSNYRDNFIEIVPWGAAAIGLILTFLMLAARDFNHQMNITVAGLIIAAAMHWVRTRYIEKRSLAFSFVSVLIGFIGLSQLMLLRVEFFLPTSIRILTACLALIFTAAFLGASLLDMVRVIKPQLGSSRYRLNSAIINIVFLVASASMFVIVGIYYRHLDAGFDPLFTTLISLQLFSSIIFVWFRVVVLDRVSHMYIAFIFVITSIALGDVFMPLTDQLVAEGPSIAFMISSTSFPSILFVVTNPSSRNIVRPDLVYFADKFMKRTSYLMIVTSAVPLIFLFNSTLYTNALNFLLTFVIGSLIVAWLWELLRVREAEFVTQKDLEIQLRERDRIDPVSGLTNRVSWMERLRETLEEQPHGVSIAYIKIVGLAGVSDAHGFKAYDAAVRGISERLKRALDDKDDVALFSNELFSFIFYDEFNQDELQMELSKLLKRVSSAYDIGRGNIVHIRGTAGGVICRVNESPSVAMQFLDQAIEAADKYGLGHVSVLSTDDKEDVKQTSHVVEEARRAINMGDMTLEFRPIVKLEDASCAAMDIVPRFSSKDITPEAMQENQELLEVIEEPYLTESCFWSVRAECPILLHVYIRERNALSIVDTMTTVINETNISPENITVLVSGRPADGTTLQAVLNPLSVLGINIAINQHQSQDVSVIELLDLPVSMLVIDFQQLSEQIPERILDDYIQRSIEMVLAMGNYAMVTNINQVDRGLDFLDSDAKYGCGDVFGLPIADTVALNLWRSKTTFSPIEPSSYAL